MNHPYNPLSVYPKAIPDFQGQDNNFTTYCGNFNTKRKIGNLNSALIRDFS